MQEQQNPDFVALDLLAAADLLERTGHCKHDLGLSPDSPHCLLGAINVVVSGQPWYPRRGAEMSRIEAASSRAHAVLPEEDQRNNDLIALVRWNNADERTAAEVVDLLRRAAATTAGSVR